MEFSKIIKSKEELKNFLKNMPQQKVVLYIVEPKECKNFILNFFKTLINELNCTGIYITFSYPYNYLKELFEKENINIENLYFIDCISNYYFSPKEIKVSQGEILTLEECMFLKSPYNLSELALTIYELISSAKNPTKKFVFLDSLNSMLIYNSKEIVIKFLHFLITKLRIFGIIGFICTSTEKNIEESYYTLFDETIKIESLV